MRLAAQSRPGTIRPPATLLSRTDDDNPKGSRMTIPLSILDLAPIAPGQTARESFAASVALAQTAEKLSKSITDMGVAVRGAGDRFEVHDVALAGTFDGLF